MPIKISKHFSKHNQFNLTTNKLANVASTHAHTHHTHFGGDHLCARNSRQNAHRTNMRVVRLFKMSAKVVSTQLCTLTTPTHPSIGTRTRSHTHTHSTRDNQRYIPVGPGLAFHVYCFLAGFSGQRRAQKLCFKLLLHTARTVRGGGRLRGGRTLLGVMHVHRHESQ